MSPQVQPEQLRLHLSEQNKIRRTHVSVLLVDLVILWEIKIKGPRTPSIPSREYIDKGKADFTCRTQAFMNANQALYQLNSILSSIGVSQVLWFFGLVQEIEPRASCIQASTISGTVWRLLSFLFSYLSFSKVQVYSSCWAETCGPLVSVSRVTGILGIFFGFSLSLSSVPCFVTEACYCGLRQIKKVTGPLRLDSVI